MDAHRILNVVKVHQIDDFSQTYGHLLRSRYPIKLIMYIYNPGKCAVNLNVTII